VPAGVSAALVDLSRAFAAVGARWYVFGAQAVIAAGVPRLTADIDVTTEVPGGGVAALLIALARRRIVPRDARGLEQFIAEIRVIPAVHLPSMLPVDVVLAGPGLEEEMLARVTLRSVRGTRIPFIATADLVALKILAGRDKDLEDVRAIFRARLPDLDRRVARDRVAELAALLENPSLVKTFDDLARGPKPRKRSK
jgi:hypothetical protein